MQTRFKLSKHAIHNQKIGSEPVISNFAVVLGLRVVQNSLRTHRILKAAELFLRYMSSYKDEKAELNMFMMGQLSDEIMTREEENYCIYLYTHLQLS